MEERNVQDWWQEVEAIKAWSSQGQMAIRCWFSIRSGTAGSFAEKKRCGFCEEDRLVIVKQ